MGPGKRQGIRWWPAAAIVLVVLALLAYLWIREAPSTQARVVPTFPTLFFGAVALFLWLVLASGLPGRTRMRIFAGTAAAVAALLALVEIRGVDGNLVPILGWRFGGDRGFEATAGGLAGAVGDGPGDYPQFYGPRRDATLPGPRLARNWKASPPREVWRREVGEGWSSFAVVGGVAITQEQRGDEELVVAYRLATGEPLWATPVAGRFDTTIGGRGPRATPTVVDGRVYVLSATGTLAALQLTDGRLLWRRDTLADHGAAAPDWGMASSPLVVGPYAVVQLGRRGIALASYRLDDGQPGWTYTGDRGTYTSPILAQLGGRAQVLVVNQDSVTGHDPATGSLLWRAPWPSGGERVTPPLILAPDRFLVSAGYGQGSRLYELQPGRDPTASLVWESPRLKSKFASMVEREGVVYGLDDGVLVALDLATGERLWKRGRYGHGQILRVDDLLLVLAENGEVVLVEANPEEHRELDRFAALRGKTWNPPALSGRLLLVRNDREAACYELPLAG